nr:hypothetical protein [Tanacetum cinerariifolium]
MGNEELNTIPKKESDEFIKSSVEDLVPIPKEKDLTFSNPLFNSNDNFTSSVDESLSDEDVPEDNVKIYLNPLFEFNDNHTTPLFDVNEDEYFTPGDDVELFLHRDPSTPMMSVVSILEGFTDEPTLKEYDDLFDLEPKNDDWKKILYDASIDDLMSEDKIFDPEICVKFFSPTYVSLPFEDRQYLFFTYVVQIFLSRFTYPVVSPFLLSSEVRILFLTPASPLFIFLIGVELS